MLRFCEAEVMRGVCDEIDALMLDDCQANSSNIKIYHFRIP